jgi:mannose-1-phosphate guanylyltransferase
MLVKGDHDWNSGMFIWQVSRIREEFERSMPELAVQLEQVRQGLRNGTFYDTLEQVWPGIKPETIDYGIMEKADNVVAVKTERLGWNDVGSWESLFETLPVDKDGNILLNVQHTGIETCDSLVTSTRTDRLIVTIGLKDMIIVDTDDALLVCARKEAQQVKELVSRLEKMGKAGYL